MSWDTNKNLSNELKSKEGTISSKNVEIRGLRAKVATLTEEVNCTRFGQLIMLFGMNQSTTRQQGR